MKKDQIITLALMRRLFSQTVSLRLDIYRVSRSLHEDNNDGEYEEAIDNLESAVDNLDRVQDQLGTMFESVMLADATRSYGPTEYPLIVSDHPAVADLSHECYDCD